MAVRLAVGGGGARLGVGAIRGAAIRGRGRAVAAGLGLGRHPRQPALFEPPGLLAHRRCPNAAELQLGLEYVLDSCSFATDATTTLLRQRDYKSRP